jgi:hypothetical protein
MVPLAMEFVVCDFDRLDFLRGDLDALGFVQLIGSTATMQGCDPVVTISVLRPRIEFRLASICNRQKGHGGYRHRRRLRSTRECHPLGSEFAVRTHRYLEFRNRSRMGNKTTLFCLKES